MNQTELQFEYKGINYLVDVKYSTISVDDSFDGHLGGYVYTFESSHKEVDKATIQIISCIGGATDDEDVDPEDVKGLYEHIIYELNEWVNKY